MSLQQEIVELVEEEGKEHNPLQLALLEFLKKELPHLLEVAITTGSAGYYDPDQKVTVKLKLGKEVISEDYFTYTPGTRDSAYY